MIPVRPTDVIVATYTSLTVGGTGTQPAQHFGWPFIWRDTLRAKYGAAGPMIINTGVAGQTLANLTVGFFQSIGIWNPTILLIDGTPNDLGIAQATWDAFWAKAVDPTQYANGQKPHTVGVFTTWVRNDESSGGANQATIQTDNILLKARAAANAASFTNGITILDLWAYWNARVTTLNPSNLTSGVLTPVADGTHPNIDGLNKVWLPVIQANTGLRLS